MLTLEDIKFAKSSIDNEYNLTLNHEDISDLNKLWKYPFGYPEDRMSTSQYEEVLQARLVYLKLDKLIAELIKEKLKPATFAQIAVTL